MSMPGSSATSFPSRTAVAGLLSVAELPSAGAIRGFLKATPAHEVVAVVAVVNPTLLKALEAEGLVFRGTRLSGKVCLGAVVGPAVVLVAATEEDVRLAPCSVPRGIGLRRPNRCFEFWESSGF